MRFLLIFAAVAIFYLWYSHLHPQAEPAPAPHPQTAQSPAQPASAESGDPFKRDIDRAKAAVEASRRRTSEPIN